jgi:hypothetical protein
VFRRYSSAHRDCAQEVTQSTQTEDNEKAEADTQQRVEKRLHADTIDDVDEQTETKQKGQGLKPDKRPSRVIGSGFGFFGEFFNVTGLPVVSELFSRFDQGDTLTPLAA